MATCIGSMVLHVDIGLATKFYIGMFTRKVQELDDEVLKHTHGFSSQSNDKHLEALSLRLEIATLQDAQGKLEARIVCEEEEEEGMDDTEERCALASVRKQIAQLKKDLKETKTKVATLQKKLTGMCTTALCCTILYCTMPYHTVPYRTILYCIVPYIHYTILYRT